jgi:hypothetical protein
MIKVPNWPDKLPCKNPKDVFQLIKSLIKDTEGKSQLSPYLQEQVRSMDTMPKNVAAVHLLLPLAANVQKRRQTLTSASSIPQQFVYTRRRDSCDKLKPI